ncbi:hypothetical protein ACFP1I_29835 [Dyadobacter subterraneus]|uniref:DUF3857 domain-containing protein n=1 Tax=Dyadobacter subterraneus TaxID=2773304 RepID=A0ABR9WKV5_9BACT|nr:hypothetical protein [Dyadobacter subterraneus]MBE9466115.1 hypothetical protein [Dyadobacter subterraneus]
MRKYILCFLTFLLSGFYVKAQQSKAREVVNLALKKHTAGKVLNQYELSVVYEKPGKAPSTLIQPDPFLQLIDSMMIAMPDSQRKEMEVQMVEVKKRMFEDIDDMYAETKKLYYVDFIAKLSARIFISPNSAKGKADSSRTINSLDKEHSFDYNLEDNPVALLRLMAIDSTELHYTGIITIESIDYKVVQVKVGTKWWDVYFDQKDGTLSKLITPQVDMDPLIGNGPVYSKDMICYRSFKKYGDFLLPDKIEKIDTRHEFTLRKKLSWITINKPFPASVFAPEPSYTSRAEYNISPISDSLFVLEQSGNYENRRSLLWINHKGEINMFTDLPNLEEFNKSEYEIVKSKLKGHVLKNIYNIKNHSWLSGLTYYFSQNIHITAPKGVGILSDENSSSNPKEDSIRFSVRKKGLFTTFDREFQNDSVKALILNPKRDQANDNIWVSYYLPNEKIVYLDGNPYSADSSSKNVRPGEKLLYDIIQSKSLKVERIVYSGAYINNAPLFMTFQDFETRIKNTDSSIYNKDKR